MIRPRVWHCAVELKSSVLACGGWSTDDWLSSVECFTLADGGRGWVEQQPMNAKRFCNLLPIALNLPIKV